jgi:uncharacterized protein YecT (DUF1311 family)
MALGLLLALALAAGAPPARAQPPAAARGCDVAGRTADEIAACLQRRIDAADAALNRTYRAALAGLDPESRARLQAAQRAWVAFREADIAADNGPWRQKRGTQLRIPAMTNTITALAEREAELRRLYLEG